MDLSFPYREQHLCEKKRLSLSQTSLFKWRIIIGASRAAEGRTFIGLLDGVRLFSEILPSERIQAIMQGGGLSYPFAYPDELAPGTTYYWRIDEVNNADPNSPWKGPVPVPLLVG